MKKFKRLFAGMLALTLTVGGPAFSNSIAFAEVGESVYIAANAVPTSGTLTTYSDIVNGVHVGPGSNYKVEWTFSDGLLTLTPSEKYEDGYAVSDIKDIFEEAKESVKKVVINGNATTIYSNAFNGMVNLESISVPDTVTYIGCTAFYECVALKEINIPSSLKYIDVAAFAFCKSLKKIVTPPSMEHIKNNAFTCSGIEKAIVSARIVDEYAFYHCVDLKSIEFTDDVEALGDHALCFSEGLESVKLSNKIENIPESLFENSGLTEITIPNSVKIIYNNSFLNAPLDKITFGESIEIIGASAFEGTNLTELAIPDSVTLIGGAAFSGTDISELTIGKNIKTIGSGAFFNTKLTEATVPANVEDIGISAFGYSSEGIIDDFIIKGYTNTVAEAYAKENGFKFVELKALDEPEVTTTAAANPLLAIPESTSAEKLTILPGDINGDGILTSGDIIPFMQYFLNKNTFSQAQMSAADVNEDGTVDVLDLATFKQFCMGDKVAGPLGNLK